MLDLQPLALTTILIWHKINLLFFLDYMLCFSSFVFLLTLSSYAWTFLPPVFYLTKHVPFMRKLIVMSTILFYLPHDWGYQLTCARSMIAPSYHHSQRDDFKNRQTGKLPISWSWEMFYCSFPKEGYFLRLRSDYRKNIADQGNIMCKGGK